MQVMETDAVRITSPSGEARDITYIRDRNDKNGNPVYLVPAASINCDTDLVFRAAKLSGLGRRKRGKHFKNFVRIQSYNIVADLKTLVEEVEKLANRKGGL